MARNLSDHFTLEELTFSETGLRKGIDNTPNEEQVTNLTLVAEFLLEPIRRLLNCAIHVNSGYRSAAVNTAIGGAPDSAHMDGRAVDFIPIGFPLADAFDILRLSSVVQYDQIIFECRAWIHVSIPFDHNTYRRQALLASGSPGHWTYEIVTGVKRSVG